MVVDILTWIIIGALIAALITKRLRIAYLAIISAGMTGALIIISHHLPKSVDPKIVHSSYGDVMDVILAALALFLVPFIWIMILRPRPN
jgi:uncharacterized membrane-anchored protein YitT (DUF2179 family)